jgi:hypothetical protein
MLKFVYFEDDDGAKGPEDGNDGGWGDPSK